jgi:hypothetical protein
MEAHYPRFMMTGIAEPVIGLTGLNHLTHSQITSIPEEAQKLVGPSSEGNMARVLDKPKQRRVGEGLPATFSSWFLERRRGFCPMYRAFTHKLSSFRGAFSSSDSIYCSYFGALRTPLEPIPAHYCSRNSTHSSPYIYSDRDSTHLFTVRAPTLLSVYSPVSDRPGLDNYRNSARFPVSSAISTVLSPTFLPFFQSLCYRSSNHATTVRLPTKELGITVLSPTKSSVNRVNLHQTFSRKDVFKRCIKKTSGLMRLFFILVFFSSEWRASH